MHAPLSSHSPDIISSDCPAVSPLLSLVVHIISVLSCSAFCLGLPPPCETNFSLKLSFARGCWSHYNFQLPTLHQAHCRAPVARPRAPLVSGEVRVGSASLLLITYHPIVLVRLPCPSPDNISSDCPRRLPCPYHSPTCISQHRTPTAGDRRR